MKPRPWDVLLRDLKPLYIVYSEHVALPGRWNQGVCRSHPRAGPHEARGGKQGQMDGGCCDLVRVCPAGDSSFTEILTVSTSMSEEAIKIWIQKSPVLQGERAGDKFMEQVKLQAVRALTSESVGENCATRKILKKRISKLHLICREVLYSTTRFIRSRRPIPLLAASLVLFPPCSA
jgi:hypothetical protein